jgi:phosphomannomutase
MALTCFKAYEIRRKLDAGFSEDIAYRIGCAYAQYTNQQRKVDVTEEVDMEFKSRQSNLSPLNPRYN